MKALSVVYDKYTVDEWMEQHIEPLINMLNGLMHRAKILTDSQIWPRRPLNFKTLSKPKKKVAAASAEKSEDRYVDVKRRFKQVDDNDNIDESINNPEIKNCRTQCAAIFHKQHNCGSKLYPRLPKLQYSRNNFTMLLIV